MISFSCVVTEPLGTNPARSLFLRTSRSSTFPLYSRNVEALNAEVEWDAANRAAVITKNDVCVVIAIGDETITVTKAGEIRTVTMDTVAVLDEGRTFVPVRFIAEALGVYVDWASYHSTACFYDDVLTPEQIVKLQDYDYTQPEIFVSFERCSEKYGEEEALREYGCDRDTFNVFANAREHLYHAISREASYYFNSIGAAKSGIGVDTFYQMVVNEAVNQVGYEAERLSVKFLADTSCIYP